jgi:SNF2 family DNA or RNA helicase
MQNSSGSLQDSSKSSTTMAERIRRSLPEELYLDFQVRCTYQIYGGLLADRMGFGKTSTTIAMIAARERARLPPIPPIDRGVYFHAPKTTLILVPTHLLNQWKEEIRK